MNITYTREESLADNGTPEGYLITFEVDGVPFCFSFDLTTIEASAVDTCESALADRGYPDITLISG